MSDPKRTPGMPPMGMPRQGPVGARVVTPEKAEALAELARQSGQAPEEPPPIPEEKSGEGEGEEGGEKKEEGLPKDAFSDLQKALRDNPYGFRDPEYARRMTFQDSVERRELIEKRCDPPELSFDDYVLRGEWRQKVPVWGEGRPVAEFRSTHVDDELIVREYQAGEYSGANNSDLTQALLMVTAGLCRLGDREFPELPAGDCAYGVRKKLFAAKLKLVKGCWAVLWDLYLNYLWFQGRIRKAMYGKDAPF